MIFVALGTHEQPFDRLLDLVLPLATEQRLVVQHGHTARRAARDVDWLEFAPYADVARLMTDADAVVCHAGVGTIVTALASGKRPLVVPRLPRHGEHVDDHQLQITAAFAARSYVVAYAEDTSMSELVAAAGAASSKPLEPAAELRAAVARAVDGEPRARRRTRYALRGAS